eukprot:3070552-Prymnesium_polylepis.1
MVGSVDHSAGRRVARQAPLLGAAVGRKRAAVAPARRIEDGALVPARIGPAGYGLHLAIDEELPGFWPLGRPLRHPVLTPREALLAPRPRHRPRAVERGRMARRSADDVLRGVGWCMNASLSRQGEDNSTRVRSARSVSDLSLPPEHVGSKRPVWIWHSLLQSRRWHSSDARHRGAGRL